jgi:uncharacterized membrane protein YecN with MAPEG domain
LLIVFLGVRIAYYRFSRKIGVGDGGDKELIKRVRAHGNTIENVPIGLLLLLILELNQTLPLWLHVFGILLVVGRVAHAWGLSRHTGASLARMIGTSFTWIAILVMAILLLWQFVLMHPLN